MRAGAQQAAAGHERAAAASGGVGRAPVGGRPLGYRLVKRAFDIGFSVLVMAAGAVPGALLCAAVAADTKGSPIYSQERVGKGGRRFRLYKFRTMVADAEDVEKYLSPEQLDSWRKERKVEDDPRITPLGGFLRRASIDEFPQFLNVLKGDMSTIGPRAITKEELDWYSEAERELLLSVPCGITGLWQTGPRNEMDFSSGARQQVELAYARHASLALDARVFFRTFRAMALKTGK